MITYRKGSLEDLKTIQRLHAKLFEYEQAFEELYDLNYDNTKNSDEYFTMRLTRDSGVIYVAEEDGKVIGYICGGKGFEEFRKIHEVVEIDSLFVDEKYRGQGIGDKLIDVFVKWSKSLNIRRVKLEVVHNNDRSISFYKRKGFKPTYFELELID